MNNPASKGRILVVDDDSQVREYLTRVLSDFGFEVDTAPDGRRAIDKAADFKPDLIVLDIKLPRGVSGIDVCRNLKEDPATANIPVIMATAISDKNTVEKSIEAGAVDYVVKPIRAPLLLAKIEKHLGGKKSGTPEETPEPPPPSVVRILLVDDEAPVLELARRILEKAEYRVEAACSGPEALGILPVFKPHIVLLDIHLASGPSGIEVCRRLKADPANADLVVMMLTGLADRENVQSAIDAGATGYIAKPFKAPTLLKKVRDASAWLSVEDVTPQVASGEPADVPAERCRRGSGLASSWSAVDVPAETEPS